MLFLVSKLLYVSQSAEIVPPTTHFHYRIIFPTLVASFSQYNTSLGSHSSLLPTMMYTKWVLCFAYPTTVFIPYWNGYDFLRRKSIVHCYIFTF